jgi:hypothetical protein
LRTLHSSSSFPRKREPNEKETPRSVCPSAKNHFPTRPRSASSCRMTHRPRRALRAHMPNAARPTARPAPSSTRSRGAAAGRAVSDVTFEKPRERRFYFLLATILSPEGPQTRRNPEVSRDDTKCWICRLCRPRLDSRGPDTGGASRCLRLAVPSAKARGQ